MYDYKYGLFIGFLTGLLVAVFVFAAMSHDWVVTGATSPADKPDMFRYVVDDQLYVCERHKTTTTRVKLYGCDGYGTLYIQISGYTSFDVSEAD